MQAARARQERHLEAGRFSVECTSRVNILNRGEVGKSLKEGPPSSYISIVYRADHHLTTLIQNFMTLIYSLKNESI